MIELREVDEEIDQAYKERRIKEEKQSRKSHNTISQKFPATQKSSQKQTVK